MENNPEINPKNELPLPHDIQLPNPHDMQISPHITHKHTWLHWLPAIFGLLIGLFVGVFVLGSAQQERNEIKNNINDNIIQKSSNPTPTLKLVNLQISNTDKNTKIITAPEFFQLTVSEKFDLIGDIPNFKIIYAGLSSEISEINDVAELEFKLLPLTIPFENTVVGEYLNYVSESDEQINFADIKRLSFSNINGYSFSCDSTYSQECLFLPIKDNYYLSIVRRIIDNNRIGYQYILDQAIATLTSNNNLNTPTQQIQITPIQIDTNRTTCNLDTKQCANGTWVSRTGPNCEFLPCPTP